MRMFRRGFTALALCLVACLALSSAALASKPKITKVQPNPVTANADGSFCFEVEVCNYGLPGDVELNAKPSAEIHGVTVRPDHHVFDNGTQTPDCWWYEVCGTLDGRSGTVTLSLSYVDNAPGHPGTPIQVQQLVVVKVTR